jgi:glycosyltransferase involved in cell wall biosynthesis
MKILYDHQTFSIHKYGGISRYFYELMKHSKGLFDYTVSGIFSDNEHAKELGLYRQFTWSIPKKLVNRCVYLLNKIDSIKKIKMLDYDIVHPTYYDPYVFKNKLPPLVIDVHDMIYEKLPQFFAKTKKIVEYKKYYFERADKIIANSQKTKTDLLEFYSGISAEKIVVIYRGASFSTELINKTIPKENYLLFTGQRGGYKNFETFILAVAPLLLKYDLTLLCTGTKFNNKELTLLKSTNIMSKVSCQFVSDAELPLVYAKAIVFVYPSLYEGFGLPILEAFAAKCPAVISNASCFPEIAGDAAIYFDPRSVQDMRSVIEKVITSPSLQTILIEQGNRQLKKYSWEKCAQETAKVYRALL